jgi:DNA repair exonuclease SbcCD ATPase subunit
MDDEIARYAHPEERRRAIEAQRAQSDDEFVRLKAEFEGFKPQIERLQKRVLALQGSDEPLCDYCGQPLGHDRRAGALADAESEIADLRAQQRVVQTRGAAAKTERDRLRAEAEQAQADVQVVARLEAQRAQAAQERLRLQKRLENLPGLRERLDRLETRLRDRDFAHEAQEKLMQVSARLEKLERVAEELAAARQEQQRLQHAPDAFAQLRSAQTIADGRRASGRGGPVRHYAPRRPDRQGRGAHRRDPATNGRPAPTHARTESGRDGPSGGAS